MAMLATAMGEWVSVILIVVHYSVVAVIVSMQYNEEPCVQKEHCREITFQILPHFARAR